MDFDKSYSVMEHFYTIQGEGAYSGHAAYFIRLGGCDVGCVWCDVKESWPVDAHPQVSVSDLVKSAQKYDAKIVVVTGGEPTMQQLETLTKALHDANFRTHIETSATNVITGDWDWITISPKKFMPPLPSEIIKADELKIIIYNKSDFDWARTYAQKVSAKCKLFLQPEWSRSDKMTPLIVDFIKQHPEWQLSLQIHKYINVP